MATDGGETTGELAKDEAPKDCSCKHWNVETFGLSPVPEDWPQVWTTSYCLSDKAFKWFRVIMLFPLMMFILIWCIIDWTVIEHDAFSIWLVYATHWQLITLSLYFIFALYTTLQYQNYEAPSSELPRSVKCTWVLQNICIGMVPMIVLLYWALVFDGTLYPLSPVTHGVTYVLLLIDLTFSKPPVYLKHAYQPMMWGAAYCLFSLIYDLCGGLNQNGEGWIYKTLDWTEKFKATSVLSLMMILVGMPLAYCFTAVFDWTATVFGKCIEKNRKDDEDHSIEFVSRIPHSAEQEDDDSSMQIQPGAIQAGPETKLAIE